MNPADRDQASSLFRSPGDDNGRVPAHVAAHHHLPANQPVVSLVPWTMMRESMSGKKRMKWKGRKTRNEIGFRD